MRMLFVRSCSTGSTWPTRPVRQQAFRLVPATTARSAKSAIKYHRYAALQQLTSPVGTT
jgi:hypothetical protein